MTHRDLACRQTCRGVAQPRRPDCDTRAVSKTAEVRDMPDTDEDKDPTGRREPDGPNRLAPEDSWSTRQR